jgi:hypothetical protein
LITVGKYNKLQVVEKLHEGIILDAEDLGRALLTNKNIPLDTEINFDDTLDVFLYHNSAGEVLATLVENLPQVGDFAFLPLKSNTSIGSFLEWGLADKDLFVPLAEQHRPFEDGKSYLVYIYLDEINHRITATSKINKLLSDFSDETFVKNQEVDLIIANSTDIGFKAIVNGTHWGILYKDQVFQELSFGQSIKGYIKLIREDERIDLSLQLAHKDLDKNAAFILNRLNIAGGFLPYHDKSEADKIKKNFGFSKNAFKKAIGTLFKDKIITIKDDGIYLNNNEKD